MPWRRAPRNYRDGAFVNIDPASTVSLDREQQRLLIRELVGARTAGRPRGPIPLATPAQADAAPGELAVCWYGHSSALVEVDGYRVLTDPVWSRAVFAVADVSARSGCTRCRCRWTRCRPSTRC